MAKRIQFLVFLAALLFPVGGAAAQTCKYDSIPASTPASRFMDNGDGTVTDKGTGLQWKRCSEGQTWGGGTCTGSATEHTWLQALQLAEGASYADESDWRLPNVKELGSIVENACYYPTIDLTVFPSTSINDFWTSSPSLYYSFDAYPWVVSFTNGETGYNHEGLTARVRLVRGGQTTSTWNDTGLDWWTDGTLNKLTPEPSGYLGQDASYGRDVTNNDDSDGHSGFSFTKLDAVGNPLPANAATWSCVRDEVTGLVWEGKTDDGALRDKDWTYSWYNADPASNGGSAGSPDATDNCFSPARCDTAKFVADVNAARLCGASDWRLPISEELRSIIDYSRSGPAIDMDWFPNIGSSWRYWSSQTTVNFSGRARNVNFNLGDDGDNNKGNADHMRLVRGRGLLDGTDTDGDGIPNVLDPDDDSDGALDGSDNCPLVVNPDQSDEDHDGIGDLCDPTPVFCWSCLPSRGGWRAIML